MYRMSNQNFLENNSAQTVGTVDIVWIVYSETLKLYKTTKKKK